MPELQKEVFPDPFHKRTGGGKVQVSQMREPKKAARFREFLFQDLQEELTRAEERAKFFPFICP
jgi:hypothetical protein